MSGGAFPNLDPFAPTSPDPRLHPVPHPSTGSIARTKPLYKFFMSLASIFTPTKPLNYFLMSFTCPPRDLSMCSSAPSNPSPRRPYSSLFQRAIVSSINAIEPLFCSVIHPMKGRCICDQTS